MPQVAIPGPARISSLAWRHSTHGKLYASEQEKGANTTRERSYHKIFPKQPQLNHLEVLTRLLGSPKKKACCKRDRPFVCKKQNLRVAAQTPGKLLQSLDSTGFGTMTPVLKFLDHLFLGCGGAMPDRNEILAQGISDIQIPTGLYD
jgi:hypothetical protein